VLKTLLGGIIGEPNALQQAAGIEPQQAAQRCCCFAAARNGA